MGRKDVLSNFAVFGATPINLAVDHTATVFVNSTFKDNVGVIAAWTGTSPVGEIFIDVSNDKSTWSTLNFGSSIVVSGNTGDANINMNQLSYDWIRVRYVAGSGTGTMTMTMTVKMVGG